MDIVAHGTAIVRKLNAAGYTAYFAGGWVRDLIMGHPSSDIDIATDAPPEVILDLFPRTILVGIAFGVVIVLANGHQYEVSTFRKDFDYVNGRTPQKIELSTPEEDALRRDFTINGMFYDPTQEKIYDFVGGREDIKKGVIRSIGDPYQRFLEDRLRMVRAFRFSARFNFLMDPQTKAAIQENATFLFPSVAIERVWQEFGKMTDYPGFERACIEMQQIGLLPVIFPQLATVHLSEFKIRVAPFAHYPHKTPTVLYLLGLFPSTSLEDLITICRYLKISGNEMKLLEYAHQLYAWIDNNGNDPIRWTYLYAHPLVRTCLKVYAARLGENERLAFLKHHDHNIQLLYPHITRIAAKQPLVTATHLIELGIPPGKALGHLLREAEAITITENLNSHTEAIEKLKASKHWPLELS